ncbi:MAG: glycosyltransferase family 9 protein [Geobacter sp.]
MNRELLKQIDGFIGRILVSLAPSPPPPKEPVGYPHSILLIRPGGIGDAVLLAPTTFQLKHSHPDATITVLAEQRNAGVFALVPVVDQVYCYDQPSEFLAVVRDSYDVVIDTEQWHRLSAVVARLVRAPIKIGFATNERRRMFTHTVPYSHDDYETESFLHLVSTLCNETTTNLTAPFLTIPEQVKTRAHKLLEPLQCKPYLVIFPGASIIERRWGTKKFREVARLLVGTGLQIVVVGSSVDQQDAAIIAENLGVNLAGKTSLAETAAVIAGAALFISADSGLLHIAIALDVPTVSLFGPGIAAKWAPHGDKHRVVNHNLPCSPCTKFGTTPPCPYNVRCMQEITPAEVCEAALQLLKEKNKQK